MEKRCAIGVTSASFLYRVSQNLCVGRVFMSSSIRAAAENQSVSLADAADIARLIARVYTSGPTYALRSTLLLDALLPILNAKLITLGILRPTRDTPRGLPSVEVVEGSHAGHLTETEQAAMLSYFADIHRLPDPAHTLMCERMLSDPTFCGALSHDQLIADDSPAWREHLNAIRSPGNVGAELFICVPTATPGLWGGITVHRQFKAPLFSPRDVALANLLAHALPPLFDARIAERRTLAVLADLTPRMRDTLVGILRGGSEKTIASELQLSKHTVHEYMKRLHTVFGVRTRTELLVQVRDLGITPEMIHAAAGTKPLLVGEPARRALRKRTTRATTRRTTPKRAMD